MIFPSLHIWRYQSIQPHRSDGVILESRLLPISYGPHIKLIGSPAEKLASTFMWVILSILVVPWKDAFESYIYKPGKKRAAVLQASRSTR
jgi:hypothetical protein